MLKFGALFWLGLSSAELTLCGFEIICRAGSFGARLAGSLGALWVEVVAFRVFSNLNVQTAAFALENACLPSFLSPASVYNPSLLAP